MRDYVISGDSNSDMPQQYIDENNINIIPQYYEMEGVVYGDELNLEPHDFYVRMREGDLPKSMGNNPAVIEDKFRAILDEGRDIIHLAFSSKLSGSYDSVCMVANELREEYSDSKIYIIDSLNISFTESLLLFKMVEYKKGGHTIDEMAEYIEGIKMKTNVEFTLDDLHHVQRGGRLSKGAAIIGSLAQIKPLLAVNGEGNLETCGSVRGRKKALKTIIEKSLANMEKDASKSELIGIVHADCMEEAQYVEGKLREQGFTNIIINDVSPSIGVHAGPGGIGVCYMGNERK